MKMKITTNLECRTNEVMLGWLDGDDWESIEKDDCADEEQIAKLLQQENANELIVRMMVDFAIQLREAIRDDLKDLYERSTTKDD